jgi:Tfp pilus assembly protein PilN
MRNLLEKRITSRFWQAKPTKNQVPFAINFVRSRNMSESTRRVLFYSGAAFLAINFLVIFWFLILSIYLTGHQVVLKHKFQKNAATSTLQSDIEKLGTEASQNLSQLNTIMDLQRNRFYSAGKLAGLARTIPSRTWITGLDEKADQRTLVIRARYLIDPKNPYQVPIKEWGEALKKDAAFGAKLTRFDLKSSTQTVEGKAEVICFELSVEWDSEEKK